jgi:membrane-bound hydrogenase subunit alpha
MSDSDRVVTVPIGPQHPALKEPESFMVDLRGEKIDAVRMRFGYNHRGIEKGCEQRSYTQDLYLVERVCGICSFSHSTAFIQAVEEIAGLELPARAKYIRTIIAELERIHSHLLWLGVAGHEIGFDTLLMYTWRDREQVMILLARLTGNRVNYGMNTVGGVRRDIAPEMLPEILKVVDSLEERTKYYIDMAQREQTVIQRLSGVGKLSREDCLKLGTVGPTARASGVDRDIRRDDPYAAYSDVTFKVITDDHCDVYGRTVVRLGELMEAFSIIRQLLKKIPDGPIAVKAPRRIPEGEAVSRYEAPRGEDVHYVRGNGSEKPERVKVRAPTLANTQSVAKMLEDGYLADLPIVIAAIDPCFSCTDRMVRLNEGGESGGRTLSWEEVSRYGIAWHKARGLDLSKVSIPGGIGARPSGRAGTPA